MRRIFRHINALHSLLLSLVVAALCGIVGCSIEPPLRLASVYTGYVTLGEIITDLEIIWEIDPEWRSRWWYGWDETDEELWGRLEYPVPTSYEARFVYHGELPTDADIRNIERSTMFETQFQHSFDYGYNSMFSWSNIDSKDGTQVVRIDETDLYNIFASTSRTGLSYATPSMRAKPVFNNPEIFYGTTLDRFHISRDTLDYDYFDRERNAWVKKFYAQFRPLVYIYLVQIVVYNNNGRITGITDNAAINSLANGVTVNNGRTSNIPVVVSYEMRLKNNLPARDGRMSDILGGKFTTFGLCDMEGWRPARGSRYEGSRTDLDNHLSVNLRFNNSTDSAYHFDITQQLRKQAHGGIVTVEIDADTLPIPNHPGTSGGNHAGFDPVVVPEDSVKHEFGV